MQVLLSSPYYLQTSFFSLEANNMEMSIKHARARINFYVMQKFKYYNAEQLGESCESRTNCHVHTTLYMLLRSRSHWDPRSWWAAVGLNGKVEPHPIWNLPSHTIQGGRGGKHSFCCTSSSLAWLKHWGWGVYTSYRQKGKYQQRFPPTCSWGGQNQELLNDAIHHHHQWN